MSEQPTQPGQRNIVSIGDHNLNVSGDHNTFNFHQPLPLPPPSPLHLLRAPVGDFVGRTKEITDLLAALKYNGESNAAGISGISGLGGIGKTELAYVVAVYLAADYPDAQLVVDMRGTDAVPRTSADALAECVRAFAGVEARLPDDEAALVRLYRECLTGRRALVVLDNAATDEQVRPFLPPPDCALLVTSRENLHLPGMKTRIQLDELAPAEARALLQEMVPRVPDAVADQICFLCGYLPLAVRAAGCLLDVTPDLDPAEYAEELRDTRARLALRYANAEGHNLSVEASFQLSYQRLPEEAARVFRALSVFPADFDGAAVEAIAADAGRLQLRELLRRNLVRYNAEAQRYELHDLARVFADAQASEVERATWQFEHARYFCELLATAKRLYKAGGAQVTKGLVLYDCERANITAGQAWAECAVDDDAAAARLCMDYGNAGAYVLQLRLHPREQIRWFEAQLAAARRLKDREDEGNALGNLGVAYRGLGEPRRAIEFFEQRLAIACEIGDRRGEGTALGNLGSAYSNLGEPRRAIEFYKQRLVIARETGDQRGVGTALSNLGNTHVDLGEPRRAIKFYEEALIIVREIGDRNGESAAISNLGSAYWRLDEARRAAKFYEEALSIAREIGNQRGEGAVLGNLGNAYASLGEPRRAIEFYEQALNVRRAIGDRRGEGTDLWNLALAWDGLGERAQAINYAEAALIIYEEIEDPWAPKVRTRLEEWQQ